MLFNYIIFSFKTVYYNEKISGALNVYRFIIFCVKVKYVVIFFHFFCYYLLVLRD